MSRREPILNPTFINNDLFEIMLQDTVFGIYEEFPEFGWPKQFERIELGYTDLLEQIDFMRDWPERKFELSINTYELDISDYVPMLARLPNVVGIGGMGITDEMFRGFDNLEHVFLGDDCPIFNAGEHSKLVSLRGSFDEGTRGIKNAPRMRTLAIYMSKRKVFNVDCLANLKLLKHLKISEGCIQNLDFLEALPNLETLVLEDATKLVSIEGLKFSKKLKHLFIQKAKKVQNWQPLHKVVGVEEAMILLCNPIDPPKLWTEKNFKIS